MAKRYGVDKMDELFNITVDMVIKAVKHCEEPVVDKKGNMVGTCFNAASLNTAIKFLKDNGIVSEVVKDDHGMKTMQAMAPFQPADGDSLPH